MYSHSLSHMEHFGVMSNPVMSPNPGPTMNGFNGFANGVSNGNMDSLSDHGPRQDSNKQTRDKNGKLLPCVCAVCGDGASEHLHYGAICCFSCRAFFRRYAGRKKCVCVRGDDKCPVDVNRRNDCMHCRLQKCVKIGMKKDYVRGPNQSLRRKREEEGFKGRKPIYKDSTSGGKYDLPKKGQEGYVPPPSGSMHENSMGSNGCGSSITLSPRHSPNGVIAYKSNDRKRSCDEMYGHSPSPPLMQQASPLTMCQSPPLQPSPPLTNSPYSPVDYNNYMNMYPVEKFEPMSPISPCLVEVETECTLQPLEYSSGCSSTADINKDSPTRKKPKNKIVAFPDVFIEFAKAASPNPSCHSSVNGEESDEDEPINFSLQPTKRRVELFTQVLNEFLVNQSVQIKTPNLVFSEEEFQFLTMVKKLRTTVVGKIDNAYYDEQYRDELTSILISRGAIKPSFRFLHKLNKSVKETSMDLMTSIFDLFDLSPVAKERLMSENSSVSCLLGAAVYYHGNSATTFVEQAKMSGIPTPYMKYLEDNGLAEVVPRLEENYLNPSPWAERQEYEIEFNEVLKKIGKHVGTDQFLTCLLIMVNLLTLSPEASASLPLEDDRAVAKHRHHLYLMLNRYLRIKFGPKKASSKTHHHSYLISLLKRVSKIYMEKKLNLMETDQISDISI
ncbi:uncharacterized protein LOC131889844 isoform X2 [Tigriopus californicus]|uniref:uncharacterized protein LOC131889844 isoform X2 n=1 Tax=Tigriopus californicus TaxID=6832 RepID=UPI0027DA3209|nr:uncharacterized protein LOC131889844 isoform X2 [Tigriopus californicus]